MRFALITAVALGTGLFTGCKDESATTPPAPRTPTTQATTQPSLTDQLRAGAEDAGDAASGAATKATDAANDAATKATDAATNAKEAAAAAGANVADKVEKSADKAGDKATDVKEDAAEKGMAAKAKEEAQKYYDQAMTAVKNKDFSAAESAMEKLEKIKPQLSPEWQDKLSTLKSTIETAKKGADVKVPGVND